MAIGEMRLLGFYYSPYVFKVKALLALRGDRYRYEEVPYGNRADLARLTGGYVHVPVLVRADGTVLTDSRRICEVLVSEPAGAGLIPERQAAATWALADWADGPFEDAAFRIASPGLRDRFTDPWERALFVLVKERKFGPGAVDRWLAERGALVERASALLAPVARDLATRPYLMGDRPSLADTALFGQLAMLRSAAGAWPEWLPPEVVRLAERIAAVADR
jgi:glutathione S-transferase